MKMCRSVLVALACAVLVAVSAGAVEYGFVRIKGKNAKGVRDEVTSLEKVVRGWKNGEILFKKETSHGMVFRTIQVIVFFAGESKDLVAFLDKAPYEGDVVKGVKGKFLFNSVHEGAVKGVTAVGLVREFPTIVQLLRALSNASAGSLYKSLKPSPRLPMERFKGAGQIYNGKIRPENFLFSIDGPNFVDEETLVTPPGWNAIKDYTEQEIKDNIANITL